MRFRDEPAYEYIDVDLEQQPSDIFSRKTDTDLTSRFSRRLTLKLPLVSANMDTVTGSRMAITLAEEGALGVLHRFLPIAEQVREVERVKRAAHFVIADPLWITPLESVRDALEMLKDRQSSSIVVVEDRERPRVVGVLSRRDYAGVVKDRLVGELMNSGGKRKLISAPQDTTQEEGAEILREHRVEKLPLVDEDGILQGLITERDIEQQERYPNATRDADGRLATAAAVGIREEDYRERAQALVAAGVDVLVVDVAHGGLKRVQEATKELSSAYPDTDIVAGNVMTAELTEALIKAGAAGVKVGIAPGYACRTRNVTGVGGGQVTVVTECAEVADEHDVPVCADGGVRELGDIGKALAAGASSVMMGSLFAGTDESPGKAVTGLDGRKYYLYRGMASLGANVTLEQMGGLSDAVQVTPEGDHLMLPAKGSVRDVVRQMAGALRSTMSYIGARTIPAMPKNAVFRVKAHDGAQPR